MALKLRLGMQSGKLCLSGFGQQSFLDLVFPQVSDTFDFFISDTSITSQYILRGTLVAWGPGSPSQVPLPSTLWLVGSGLLGFARFNRRDKDFSR